VPFTEFITWFPFTDIAELSTEADKIGTKRAEVLLPRTRLEKDIRPKNNPRNLNSRLNHPPPRGYMVVIFGLAYSFILP